MSETNQSNEEAAVDTADDGGLSQEKRDEYVASGGNNCPYCGQQDLHAERIKMSEHEGDVAVQEVGCMTCYRKWKDRYILAGIITQEDEGDQPEPINTIASVSINDVMLQGNAFADPPRMTQRASVMWFGPSWNAPVCTEAIEATKIPRRICLSCRTHIGEDQHGLLIPTVEGVNNVLAASHEPLHLNCLLRVVGLHSFYTPRP